MKKVARDIDVIREMLERAHIDIDVCNRKPDGSETLTIERGYAGFVVDLSFNPDGSLRNIEAFE